MTVFGTATFDTREVLISAEKCSEYDFSKQPSHQYNYISVKHKMKMYSAQKLIKPAVSTFFTEARMTQKITHEVVMLKGFIG